jgi:hypothetical protein
MSTFDDLTFIKIPGEDFLFSCLQKELSFYVGNKIVKKGRLILFKRTHFFIQITLCNSKKEKENFEIPFPFSIEEHNDDNVIYFDYRVESLNAKTLPIFQNKVSSSYFNKILEIVVND